MDGSRGGGELLVEWKGDHQSASGNGCLLDVGYHRPVCVETDVGTLHHYRRMRGADNGDMTVPGHTKVHALSKIRIHVHHGTEEEMWVL